jgi:hypothetical protein
MDGVSWNETTNCIGYHLKNHSINASNNIAFGAGAGLKTGCENKIIVN